MPPKLWRARWNSDGLVRIFTGYFFSDFRIPREEEMIFAVDAKILAADVGKKNGEYGKSPNHFVRTKNSSGEFLTPLQESGWGEIIDVGFLIHGCRAILLMPRSR